MFLDKYLTEYDESLSGESYIDPLGMLIIWSAYGQEIFHNRVNSISNDVRNYTLNLFNHYLVRRMGQEQAVTLSPRLESVYVDKDTLPFKYASLLYLENLFVFSILKHESREIESVGVLGISNGRRRWIETHSNPALIFSHEKPGQLLVRQLGLGVSGRYKTPMREIGYFDNNYHYHLPSIQERWRGVEQFIAGHQPLNQLAELLIQHLQGVLSQNSKQPVMQFIDVPEKITSAFANAFASSGAVGAYARDYWLSATGLDTNAAGALLKVLDDNVMHAPASVLMPQQLMALTDRSGLAEQERRKIERIEQLEPFLADAMLMFNFLTHKKSQPLQVVIERWRDFGRDEMTLPQRAQQLRANQDLLGVLKGAARDRLNQLLNLADTHDLAEQIRLLIDYHGKVMAIRGQQPWLKLDDKGIRVQVRPLPEPSKEDWPQGVWYNNYYLPQFQRLVRGYQGGSV